MRAGVIAALMAGLALPMARAERPPERREDADAVVVGKVKKVATKMEEFGGDGVATHFTAEVEVAKVDKGEGLKAGQTIRVKWFRVTKTPTKPIAGAFGHVYKIDKGDEARFWLMGSPKKGFEVIYNRDGVEKLDR
ncbi:MAG: hypothetical protein U0797_23095 [Gemmataceae bacterium]